MNDPGTLYLIPTPLGEMAPADCLPQPVIDRLQTLSTFVVEELRTARRFLSAAGLKGRIADLRLEVLNEHTPPQEVEALAALFEDGREVGLLSEAGLPAVADPGARLVALCHRRGIRVVPLPGPSSLMLALMASGLNGQAFAFRGYLPAKPDTRRAAIARAERQSADGGVTQLFIETPYRNDALLADILATCHPDTLLCTAASLTCPDETIRTAPVAEWRRSPAAPIGKRPCVFALLARPRGT